MIRLLETLSPYLPKVTLIVNYLYRWTKFEDKFDWVSKYYNLSKEIDWRKKQKVGDLKHKIIHNIIVHEPFCSSN